MSETIADEIFDTHKSYLIERRIHFDGLLRHAREFEFLMRKQKKWIAKFCASKEVFGKRPPWRPLTTSFCTETGLP